MSLQLRQSPGQGLRGCSGAVRGLKAFATKWLCPHHKSFAVSKSLDAMQRLVSSPAHFKAEGTKISQRAQCMAMEARLCLLCVVEKCHEQSIVLHEMGSRLGRGHCSISSLLESPLLHAGSSQHRSDFWQTASAPGTPLPPTRQKGTNPV